MDTHDKYCSRCGAPIDVRIPAGDNRPRRICNACDTIHYDNPHVVVGAVCLWHDQVLLCRRAIPPRIGYWTFPAGYLEQREDAEAGACREAWEEANADIAIHNLLGVYSLPHISQVQLIYLATLNSADVAAGPESQEVQLFGWEEIPWQDLAFPTVEWALRYAYESRHRLMEVVPQRTAALQIGRRKGSGAE